MVEGYRPSRYRNVTPVMERLARVADMRRKSPTKSVQRDAETGLTVTRLSCPLTSQVK